MFQRTTVKNAKLTMTVVLSVSHLVEASDFPLGFYLLRVLTMLVKVHVSIQGGSLLPGYI